MVRVIALVSLCALLALVPYVPAAYPPQAFIAQIRAEHRANQRYWGAQQASRIMSHVTGLALSRPEQAPLMPRGRDGPSAAGPGLPAQMARLQNRFFSNPYFRSLDMLMLLAGYRLAALLSWLPAVGATWLACLIDGAIVRCVKSREMRLHNPEVVAACAAAAILLACLMVVALVLPVTLPPWLSPAMLLVLGPLLNRVVANYHKAA